MMTDGSAEPVPDAAGRAERGCGVLREYVCPARDQMFLLPVSMWEWIPEGHLAWFVLDVVAQMDTRALHSRPAGAVGRRPHLPEMMLALVLYGYCCGIRFSRRLEAACRTDAAFRVICGGLSPDHATIARFVVDHERALEDLFVEGLRLCAAAGLVDLSVVALDGTKIAADASIARNRGGEWIRGEIAKLMAQTGQDACDAQDALSGVDRAAPASETSPTGRLGRLEAALAVIEAEDAAVAAQTAQRTAAAGAASEQGRQLRGRKPKDPQAALARAEVDHQVARDRLAGMQADAAARQAATERGEPPQPGLPRLRIDKATRALERAEAGLQAARHAVEAEPAPVHRANVTDPDSRIMSTRDGWVQGYNCQAIANPNQIVLACEATQDANDVQQYEPMTRRLGETLTRAGIIDPVALALADAGYWSEHNATCPGIDRLIATLKDHKQRRAAREHGHTDGPPPPEATTADEMEHLLRTPQGAAAYKQRSQLIEPVFGDRKHNRNTRRFRRRGLSAVRSEWAFINLAGNLLKLHHHQAGIA
jgi:transposase